MDSSHAQVSSLSISQQEEDKPKEMECPTCHQKSTMTCSACKSVAYCCVEHQKLDWKNHKNACQPFVIKKTENMGLGWFATRDLKAGVVLIEEIPAIQAPEWKNVCNRIRKCLACGVKILTKRNCSTCSWPVCSRQCEKDPLHSDNECKELACRKIKYPPPASWPVGMLTMLLRAMAMKIRDPRKFKQLMALQDFVPNPSTNQSIQDEDLPPGMFEVLSGPESLDRDEFRKLLRILRANGYNGHFSDEIPEQIRVVYLKTSRLNHSCIANCKSDIGPAPDYKSITHTSVAVSKGDQLTMNFSDILAFGFQTTAQRQIHLLQRKGFTCKCKRCLDPTELGTFLSGIKCFSCSSHLRADSYSDDVGFLVPANPIEPDSPAREYECHRCHVKHSLWNVMQSFPEALQPIFVGIGLLSIPEQVDLKALDILMTQYEDNSTINGHLHKNHEVINVALRKLTKFDWMSRTLDHFEAMTVEELERLVRRLEHILTIDDQLFPGSAHSPRSENLTRASKAVRVLRSKVKLDFTKSVETADRLVKADKYVKVTRSYFKVEKARIEFLKLDETNSKEDNVKLAWGWKQIKKEEEEFEQIFKTYM